MQDLYVWLRAGDADEYHQFDSVDEAAAELHDYCIEVNDEMAVRRYEGRMFVGIEIPDAGYVQENGISLFWGDGDAQIKAPLDDYELEVFVRTFNAG